MLGKTRKSEKGLEEQRTRGVKGSQREVTEARREGKATREREFTGGKGSGVRK